MSGLESAFYAYPALSWAVIGVVFLIVEVIATHGFFVPFAASAFIMALAVLLGLANLSFLWAFVIFLAIGVALILPLRRLLRRYLDRQPDINKY